MRTKSSTSERSKSRARACAQGVVLDHIKLMKYGDYRHFVDGVDEKDRTELKLSKIPSPGQFIWLSDFLQRGGVLPSHEGEFGFMYTPHGPLVFHNNNVKRSKKRFKARRNFEHFLLKLDALVTKFPDFKKEAEIMYWKQGDGSYKMIRDKQALREARKEVRSTIRLEDEFTIVLTGVKDRKIIQKITSRFATTQRFALTYRWRSYQDFKKFRQRVRAEGLIR